VPRRGKRKIEIGAQTKEKEPHQAHVVRRFRGTSSQYQVDDSWQEKQRRQVVGQTEAQR
jgi:hypothetical protein